MYDVDLKLQQSQDSLHTDLANLKDRSSSLTIIYAYIYIYMIIYI